MSTDVTLWRPEEELNPIERAVQKVNMVNALYEQVMSRDLHYGKIAGTDRDTLLLPGAQKICQLFDLAPRIRDEKVRDFPGGHREIEMVVSLENKKSGQFWGEGTGSCSTMESKFRYRWHDAGPVPQEYWENRNDPAYAGMRTVKRDNFWMFQKRVEHPDIADMYNVIRKMCFKRALVSATITAAGIGDIFNQDLEEMSSDDIGHPAPSRAPVQHSANGHAPAPVRGKLDFNALTAELSTINTLDHINSHRVDLDGKFPAMSEKQRMYVDKIYDARIKEIEDMMEAAR